MKNTVTTWCLRTDNSTVQSNAGSKSHQGEYWTVTSTVKPHNCATTIQQWVQWVTGVCVCAQWITYCGCGCVKEWWADSGFQMPSGLCSWSVFSEPALFCVDDGYHWHSQTDMHIQYTGIGTGPADPTAAIAIIWQTRIFMVTLYQLLWMWNEQKHKQKKMHTLWSTDSQEH